MYSSLPALATPDTCGMPWLSFSFDNRVDSEWVSSLLTITSDRQENPLLPAALVGVKHKIQILMFYATMYRQ